MTELYCYVGLLATAKVTRLKKTNGTYDIYELGNMVVCPHCHPHCICGIKYLNACDNFLMELLRNICCLQCGYLICVCLLSYHPVATHLIRVTDVDISL